MNQVIGKLFARKEKKQASHRHPLNARRARREEVVRSELQYYENLRDAETTV